MKKEEINNSFLWLVALVPLSWILQMWLFAAIPMECSLKDAFLFGEFVSNHAAEDPMLARLFWPSVVWVTIIYSVFYVLDEMEVNKRGFNLGGWLIRCAGYLVVPVYLWIRGVPSLNNGKRNLLPYFAWWMGTIWICHLESGYVCSAAATALALLPLGALAFRKVR